MSELRVVYANHGLYMLDVPMTTTLKGLGMDCHYQDPQCGDVALTGAAWWHNWSHHPMGCDIPNFIPTIYGLGQMGEIPPESTWGRLLLGFNEPDQSGKISPRDAALKTAGMIQQYQWYGHWTVGSHTCIVGTQWMSDYIYWLDGFAITPALSVLTCNYYPQMCSFAQLEQVKGWADARGWGLVVKEFNCELGDDLLDWFIENGVYAGWFVNRNPGGQNYLWERPLVDGDGNLTVYGELFKEW